MTALWRVRVLTTERTFSPYSPNLTRDEALALQDQLEDAVVQLADGARFVHFQRSSGVQVSIRARAVIAIEVVPPGRDRQPAGTRQPFVDEVPPAPAPAPSPAVLAALSRVPAAAAGSALAAVQPGPGTAFLQSHKAQHPKVRPARHGGQP